MPLQPSDTGHEEKATSTNEAADFADIKRKSIRGGAITLVSQAVNIGTGLVSTVVLARLLSPGDYGLIAMVLAVTGFAVIFQDLGLSSAAIQKKDLTVGQQSNLFWLNVLMGTALTILLAVGSPIVAWFYEDNRLVAVTITLSCTFLIGSLGSQHAADLTRNMQFGKLALAGISGNIVGVVTAIALAAYGMAYWALVFSTIAAALTTTLLFWILSSFHPVLPRRGTGVSGMIRFGANLTAFSFVNYFSRNLDNILIEKFCGLAELGLYTRAYSLLMLPINSIRGPINAVAFPAMSKMQDKPEQLRDYYCKTTSVIALLSMPITAFFFAASEPIILLLLGEKWIQVSPIFSILAISAFIQPASGFAGNLLLSQGQGSRLLACGIFNGIIVALSFFIGIRWGAIGVAISYTAAIYITLIPWLCYAYRSTPVSIYDFAKSCAYPISYTSIALIATFLLKNAVAKFSSPVQILLLGGIFFFSIFLLLVSTKSGRKNIILPFYLLNIIKKNKK